MTREDFKEIIKLRSFWKVDKRKGNYLLPNGKRLSSYIVNLVRSQMELDHLAIRENGDLGCIKTESYWDNVEKYFTDIEIFGPFGEDESCGFDEQERRISKLVFEIVG